ncbi:MAG: hypothetical protein ABWY00_09740 [Dongiaceae bacterium]
MQSVQASVACGVLILGILSGCAATPSEKIVNVSPGQGGPADCMKITADNVDTRYGETVTVGMILGGVGGAIVGTLLAVVTQDPSAIVAGAVAGAAIGTAGGAYSGVKTAESLQAYAVQEAQLDCQIDAAREDNERLSMLVDALRETVRETQLQLDDLETRYVAGRVSKNAALRELDAIDQTTNRLERSVASMKKRRDDYIDARAQTQMAAQDNLNTSELDQQIAAYNAQITASENELKKLAENRRVAQVG